jgi:hypothetical protein
MGMAMAQRHRSRSSVSPMAQIAVQISPTLVTATMEPYWVLWVPMTSRPSALPTLSHLPLQEIFTPGKAFETSFNFSFNANINGNATIYSETGGNSNDATIQFCAVVELLRDAGSTKVLVKYAEYAFKYVASLDGSIELVGAFQVVPAEPITVPDTLMDIFTVSAEVCGPGNLDGDSTLNQGDAVHICITSNAFPEASIAGIHTLTYSAPFGTGADVTFNAITAGSTVDALTKFVVDTDDCNGERYIVKTQLQGMFYHPINGNSKVNIQGLATLQLGDISLRRVLAKAVPGDRSLQEMESLKDFTIEVKTTAASDILQLGDISLPVVSSPRSFLGIVVSRRRRASRTSRSR